MMQDRRLDKRVSRRVSAASNPIPAGNIPSCQPFSSFRPAFIFAVFVSVQFVDNLATANRRDCVRGTGFFDASNTVIGL